MDWNVVSALGTAAAAFAALFTTWINYKQRRDDNRQRDKEARIRDRLLVAGITQECDQAAGLAAKKAFDKVELPLWRESRLEYLAIDARYGTKISEYMPLADYKTRGLEAGIWQSNDAHDETDEAEMAGRIYILARNEAREALRLCDERDKGERRGLHNLLRRPQRKVLHPPGAAE